MDLQSFADKWSDDQEGTQLDSVGPHCRRLFQHLRNEGKTRSYVATKFWQSFLGSVSILRAAKGLDIDYRYLVGCDKVVVYRPAFERFDLLFLVHEKLSEPRHLSISLQDEEIFDGFDAWNKGTMSRVDDMNNPGLVVEAVHAGQPFGMIVATAPQSELTYAPSPWCGVDPGTGVSSSVGIIAKDKAGRKGVTTALHAIGIAKNVMVNGVSGTVVTTNLISDSCFIEMSATPSCGSKGQKGPLSGLLPRGNQSAEFENNQSKIVKTVITGWSPELPTVQQYNQLKIYTQKDTDPGDSGAVLVTDDDYLAGFAFERTQFGAPIEFSTWIWADLVGQNLQLEFV
jgi:hypothetical protein